MIAHSMGKTILLIPPSTLLAVEFSKVSSIGEHVPDDICELDSLCHSVYFVQ